MAMADQRKKVHIILAVILVSIANVVLGTTDPGDFKVLNDFKNGLDNPQLLGWPSKGNNDPCGPPSWKHVVCRGGRITQIQVQNMGLSGILPPSLNQLVMLENVGLQKNKFRGALPSFCGLSGLQEAYLDNNDFDSIPSDFFNGLTSVRTLALDQNPFNSSTGWSIPPELQNSTQLANFSCSSCNLVGELPDFLGNLVSLTSLKLSYNNLSGELPPSFAGSNMQVLWLNNQYGGGLTGPIDVIGNMTSLLQVWLHGNQFTGAIPDNIGDLASLRQLNLNGNRLVGLIPQSLANMSLDLLNLNNNMLMGPIPKFQAENASYSSNSFCQSDPGELCAPEVNALLDFLHDVNYPTALASQWTGNDPCKGPWLGISCNPRGQVSVINLQKLNLNGTLSPSLAKLGSLLEIHLAGNNLHGLVPPDLTQLKTLRLLDIKGNNFDAPLPNFGDGVKVISDGNPGLEPGGKPKPSPPVVTSPSLPSSPPSSPNSPKPPSGTDDKPPPSDNEPPSSDNKPSHASDSTPKSPSLITGHHPDGWSLSVVVEVTAGCILLFVVSVVLVLCYLKKKKNAKKLPTSIVVQPKDPSQSDDMVKIVIADPIAQQNTVSSADSKFSSGGQSAHVIEDGQIRISVQILRKVTKDFSEEIGRGGFGAVYKGELDDGLPIAVKRMESGVISNKALDEFQAEIEVLSKVRHRNLVSLLGFSVEGNERLLVYEYMPQGALSRHLFRWKQLDLQPLSWARRLSIALDVARGVDYLHNLAHRSFIHRDLKSANILLDDNYRAKVADFGLVKLAPDKERSVATKLAGTFGYLAPEYAVTGKITTKVDVFSFGVVLVELLTGLVALDEQRSEENRYLAEWFWKVKADREKLIASLDPALDAKEDIYDSIFAVADLAGHCTNRDPNNRPDMGYAVVVLSALAETWKPTEGTEDEYGIDYSLPLPQMLKGWQEEEAAKGFTGSSQDSQGSIPSKPAGFADSLTSNDAR
ncbi:OLC1v1004748C1 [Oldenlandia corymbosa var. corymbosa]|uniref:OLC1v1004748C1 n=1 Tax=Oldenlandia corymbosa var. corymbosa TaxID=529605 RepID=A0AAV1DGG7_OLDCO|nr:OLC1v1004748C1 [Oldenlandia corymbosa var. corymbosa]